MPEARRSGILPPVAMATMQWDASDIGSSFPPVTKTAPSTHFPANRTFVCSVLFLDIANYSTRSVAEQMALKQRFNRILEESLRLVAVDERIVLDTGDGAAVSFLANPEDSLFAAMALRDACAAEPDADTPALPVRMGIHLGPVRLIKDINGRSNIIGDGINAAQRVMSFAEPGAILVSRAYHEVVTRLSDDYARLFSYGGTRLDKHVRKHALYAVAPAAHGHAAPSAAAEASPAPKLRAARRTVGAVAIAAGAIALLSLAASQAFRPTPPVPETAPAAASAPATETAVELAISPWGEIHVDGQPRGVSPPLTQLTLAPGRHRIEIRNADLPPHVVEIAEHGASRIAIQHRF